MGWSINVSLDKIHDKKERSRIKTEYESAKLKSPKEIYEGFYDRKNQHFYVFKITYPYTPIKAENINYDIYNLQLLDEKGDPFENIEGDYEDDKGILHVNDDFDINIVLHDIPKHIQGLKHNAVFGGPSSKPTESYNGYYTEDEPKNMKFYALSRNPIGKNNKRKRRHRY